MEKISIVFLILHYMDEGLTYGSIETLKKLEKIEQCKIVVVDNGSSNNSGLKIKKKYENDGLVDVLLLEKNSGFSRGNNEGYHYIKNQYNFNFLVVMNNDVFIYQKDFIDRLCEVYKDEPFNVAGPDIYVPQNVWHSSPLRKKLMDKKNFVEYYRMWEEKKNAMQKNFCIGTYKKYLESRVGETKGYQFLYSLNRKIRGQRDKWYQKRQRDCVLQGACLIFDRVFVEKNDNVFYPETFLYSEEDILAYQCLKKGYKTVYYPELQVYHICHGSSKRKKETYNEFRVKKSTEFQRILDSLEIFAKLQGIEL